MTILVVVLASWLIGNASERRQHHRAVAKAVAYEERVASFEELRQGRVDRFGPLGFIELHGPWKLMLGSLLYGATLLSRRLNSSCRWSGR